MLTGADSVGGRLGGVEPANVCNAMFLTVRIQTDSHPFRSTQRYYCAFDCCSFASDAESPEISYTCW